MTTRAGTEIQTCNNWHGEGLKLFEMNGGTRHRWHCFDCGDKGPAEVDGAVCKRQLVDHIRTAHA